MVQLYQHGVDGQDHEGQVVVHHTQHYGALGTDHLEVIDGDIRGGIRCKVHSDLVVKVDQADLLKQLVQKSVVLQNGHPGIGPQQKIHPHGQHDEHHSDALHLRPLLGEHIGYRVSDQQSDQCGDDGQLKRAGEHRCIGTHAGEVLQREVPGGGAEGIDHHNDDGRHHEDGHPSHIGNGEQ